MRVTNLKAAVQKLPLRMVKYFKALFYAMTRSVTDISWHNTNSFFILRLIARLSALKEIPCMRLR